LKLSLKTTCQTKCERNRKYPDNFQDGRRRHVVKGKNAITWANIDRLQPNLKHAFMTTCPIEKAQNRKLATDFEMAAAAML
jgi:hypothetical protein